MRAISHAVGLCKVTSYDKFIKTNKGNFMKRPELTKDMILQGCRTWIAESNCVDDIEKAELIAKHWTPVCNGYQLARDLESNEGWDINVLMVEELDCVHHNIDEVLKIAEVEWFENNNIQPKLKVGDETRYGVITGIYEYRPARYLIQEPDKPTSQKRIIKFEDVEN